MEPKIIEIKSFKVVGMDCKTSIKNNTVPKLWSDFAPRMNEIKNAIENKAYGICICNCEGSFTDETEFREIASLAVTSFDNVPKGMVTYEVEGGKYAVFTHKGALSNLRMTYDYIYSTWVLKGEHELRKCDSFELYDERFDCKSCGNSENSELDIYVPIK